MSERQLHAFNRLLSSFTLRITSDLIIARELLRELGLGDLSHEVERLRADFEAIMPEIRAALRRAGAIP